MFCWVLFVLLVLLVLYACVRVFADVFLLCVCALVFCLWYIVICFLPFVFRRLPIVPCCVPVVSCLLQFAFRLFLQFGFSLLLSPCLFLVFLGLSVLCFFCPCPRPFPLHLPFCLLFPCSLSFFFMCILFVFNCFSLFAFCFCHLPWFSSLPGCERCAVQDGADEYGHDGTQVVEDCGLSETARWPLQRQPLNNDTSLSAEHLEIETALPLY